MSNNLNFEAAQLPAAQTTRAAVADALWGSLLDKRERKVKTLTLVAVLGAKRKSGKLFNARKRYRLDTRGMKALHADLNQFVGDSPDIDFESLDPETAFMPAKVGCGHSNDPFKAVGFMRLHCVAWSFQGILAALVTHLPCATARILHTSTKN